MYQTDYYDKSDEEYTYEDEEEEYEDDCSNDLNSSLNNDTISLSQSYEENNIDKLLKVPQEFIDNEIKKFEDLVWIPDQKLAFRLCNVIERKTDTIYVQYVNENGSYERKIIDANNVQTASLSHYCADMCNLTELNEPSILHTIRLRYELQLIHTYSGLFCVVVNPWKNVPIYTQEIIDFYMNQAKVDQNLPPHIYSIAQSAYDGIMQGSTFNSKQNLMETHHQSILITGESGAGKTENTKKIIEYLICCASASNNLNLNHIINSENLFNNETKSRLDSVILKAGIALEAFSNAKTIHNNNSSRLGKFIRLDFDENAKLSSARIDCYLLEKSRVVNQNEGDRNFHIFYQIFSSCNKKTRQALGLNKTALDYRFLNQGNCVYVDGIDDYNDALITEKALDQLEFSSHEKSMIFECIASCILIGEIRFSERSGLDISFVQNSNDVNCVAKLIGVDSSRLIDALTQPSIRIGDSVIQKTQNLKKTLSSTSALAKVIYERLFMWILDKCNQVIESKSKSKLNSLNAKNINKNFIGVLDMAGFEIMNQNSFEQLCINYTNEKLQQFFNQVLFIKEKNEFINEGIEWNQNNFGNDLQQTIDMIEKPMGLLSLLQEECIVLNGKDSCLLEKFYQNLTNLSNGVFTKAKFSSKNKSINHFIISHYAGQVAYNIDNWVEKNRNLVDQSILEVMSKSTHSLISHLFFDTIKTQKDLTLKNRRGALTTSTISCIYKEQLSNLIQTLNSSTAHFIRCIVPNYERQPFVLNGPLVINQLKCNGVLEGIRVYRRGYPNRILFKEFIRRYNILYQTQIYGTSTITNESLAVENMCKNLKINFDRYKIGRTKIFCRMGLISELENWRKECINYKMIQFQAWIKWYLAQKQFLFKKNELAAVIIIQDSIRNAIQLTKWPWFKLWLKIKDYLPIVKNQKRLKELEEENLVIQKENKKLISELNELNINKKETKNEINRLVSEQENSQRNLLELREELKRNENLLELMEKKFDDQHAKIKRLNNSLNESIKNFEKLEEEKYSTENQLQQLTKRFNAECEKYFLTENELKKSNDESKRLQTKLDSLFDELKLLDKKVRFSDEEVNEWKEKFDKQKEEIASMNLIIADANEQIKKCGDVLQGERNLRRKYENEIDEFESEINQLRSELEKMDIKQNAVKEQLRLKDNLIKKIERKLEDKTIEMETCVNELKKMHKTSQNETQTQLEELKKKYSKLELENKQQKSLLEAANNTTVPYLNNGFDRESSVDSDYSRTSTLGRYINCRNLMNNSGLSINNSSTLSIRALSNCRRDTEPEILNSYNRNHIDSHDYGSLYRSSSNSSSSNRLYRKTPSSIMSTSVTNTIDSGITRSSSSCFNTASKLHNSEMKVSQLERDLHASKTDNQLTKRELEIYKKSLLDAERTKTLLEKQVKSLNVEIENLTKSLKNEEEKSQKLNFDARKSINDCESWKKRSENLIQESKDELCEEKKKHLEKLEELKYNYELKIHHLTTTQKNFDKMQTNLIETQSKLDKAIAQIGQMERMQKSQTTIGETWESQYRSAMQEIEQLRDDNAALKSKIRRQYKQIELLTQQSEINEYVNKIETKVDNLSNRVEKSNSIIDITATIMPTSSFNS